MSSSKPRDAFGRFSRTDPPTGDGGGEDNGTIDPNDISHAARTREGMCVVVAEPIA